MSQTCRKAHFTLTELAASVSASAIFISEGMHRGWSAPAFPKLKSNGPINLTNDDIMWLEAIYFFGELVSIPLVAYLVDRVGRKTTILTSAAIGLIAWTIIALSNHVVPFYVARFLAGATGNISMVSVSIYISEISNPKSRSCFLGTVCFVQTLGILLVYALVPNVVFYLPSVVANSVLILQLGAFYFMPESPYYHVLRKQENLARLCLDRLRRPGNNDEELDEIRRTVDEQKTKQSMYEQLRDVAASKRNKKALVIATVLYAGLQFSGFSFTMMNVGYIFKETNAMYLDSCLAEIVFAVLMVIGNALCLLCLNRIGRRRILLVSSASSGIFLLGVAIYFNLMRLDVRVSSVSWISTLCITAYAVCFYLGYGSLIEPMSAELFSTDSRALGTSFTNAIDSVFGILSIILCNLLMDYLGIDVAYYLFGVVSVLNVLFIVFFLPETDGQSLQEIQTSLE